MFLGAVNTARKACIQRGGKFVKGQCYMPEVGDTTIPGAIIEPAAIDAAPGTIMPDAPTPWYRNKWLVIGGVALVAALVLAKRKGGSNV